VIVVALGQELGDVKARFGWVMAVYLKRLVSAGVFYQVNPESVCLSVCGGGRRLFVIIDALGAKLRVDCSGLGFENLKIMIYPRIQLWAR
jgi:hypothetical protein